MKTLRRRFQVYLAYSPDEGGWYAEIYDPTTGKELWQSRVFKTEAAAKKAAERWLMKN